MTLLEFVVVHGIGGGIFMLLWEFFIRKVGLS